MGPRADEGADIHQPKQLVRNKIVIAGNYANNFQYAPEWLWEKNLTPTQFMTYMALRYFSYPTGPTVAMLVDKTGFDTAVIEETLHSLLERELVEPCVEDEFGQPADDRWRFCYYKYVKDAPDQAPVPVPDDSDPEYHLKQFQARMARSKEAFYAANPGAKEAEERRALDEAEWHAAERRQFEEQRKKLDDPNYLRSGGPINPDINGMVDTVKHLGWSALAQIAGIQYHLAELTGLALLDPDANDTLQNELHHLAEAVEWGAIRGVLDYTEIEAHDYLYEEEFWNTFTDGREIAIRIKVEEERHVGAPILESPATIEFPHGTIYHINPVTPKPEGT